MSIEIVRQTNEQVCEEIYRLLKAFAEGLEYRGWNNLTDWHVYAEDVIRAVLEPTFDYTLTNANISRSNKAAIDLEGIDDAGGPIVVQVSSDSSRGKIQQTLNSTHLPKDGIDQHLVFMFLVERHPTYHKDIPLSVPRGIEFDPDNDVLDIQALVQHIRHHSDPDRCKAVLERLRREIKEEGADSTEQVETKHIAFYEYVYKRFAKSPGRSIYGEIPLRDSYIEPVVCFKDVDGQDQTQDVRSFIESWVEDDGTIGVICGEPGHGKTALCEKAMYDFYKEGWLADKVSNVFHFSLNPANTDALASGSFYLDPLLSWGRARKNPKHMLEAEDCCGALVFLDGFDELIEWHPHFNLEGFIRDYVTDFQEETNAHVIITSRSMVVDSDKDAYEFDWFRSPIARLQPISKEQQIAWIERYTNWCRDKGTDRSSQVAGQLVEYLEEFRQLREDADLQGILGIPIIFRMIAVARYLPKNGTSIVQMYDKLFDITWERHTHDDSSSTEKQREASRADLSKHALRVFCDNNDTALVQESSHESSWPLWSFSFYTTHEGKKRVGFLHRSFYQHFLAREVFSWFEEYARKKEGERFRVNLTHLARRRIDKTTLQYVRDLCSGFDDAALLDSAFEKAYEILKQTDGSLPLPSNVIGVDEIKEVTPLERANNIFWNTVSICSTCGYPVSTNKVNERPLWQYPLDDSILDNAMLNNALLMRALLQGADLTGADLTGADLRRATLEGAVLRGASLTGAFLRQARLREAHLEGAVLRGANLAGASLEQAHLEEADLRRTQLQRADLGWAHLEGADLSRARLQGACLEGADLMGANLRRAHLEGADLRRADLWGACLEGASLVGANLTGTVLTGAILRHANLTRTILDVNNQVQREQDNQDNSVSSSASDSEAHSS